MSNNAETLLIEKTLVLSTANVCTEGRDFLDAQQAPFAVYDKEGYGWWVYVPKGEDHVFRDQKHNVPASVLALLDLASKNDCAWVMLDCYADPCKSLPTYEW